MHRLRIVVRGSVQGVGYRAWTAYEASRRDLEGWVRNRRDGTVEAVFSGTEAAVAAMVEACRKGPHAARVTRVETLEAGPDALDMRPQWERFAVLPTA